MDKDNFDEVIESDEFAVRFRSLGVPINGGDINGEFIKYASDFHWVNTLASEARSRLKIAELELESVSAALDDEIRAQLELMKTQNEKFKYTETGIRNQILKHPKYQTAHRSVTELNSLFWRLNGTKESLIERRYTLVTIAANARVGAYSMRVNDASVESKQGRAKELAQQRAERRDSAVDESDIGLPPIGGLDPVDDTPPSANRGRRRPRE